MAESAVILVNWRGAEETLACLAALGRLEGGRPYTIVVENGSGDDSAETLRGRAEIDLLIESTVNLGFGGGCNLGVAKARELGLPFVWLLNNDAAPEPGALAALVAVMQGDGGLGAVGSVLHEGEGDWNCGMRVSFWTGQVRRARSGEDAQYISGASMLLRVAALTAVGDFDERFFLYWEDADLCFRLRKAGWRLGIARESHVRHAVSVSASKAGRKIIQYYNEGAMLFYRRYAPAPAMPALANFLYRFLGQVKAGEFANAMMVLRTVLRFFKKQEVLF